jgi:hypothetical protein
VEVIRLGPQHGDLIKPLFTTPKFMGVDGNRNYFIDREAQFSEFYHKMFCNTYLTDLQHYIAFAAIEDGVALATIAFYQSIDDASWWWNTVRTRGNQSHAIQHTLDEVLRYNESTGRLKFYSMFPAKYRKSWRKLAFSDRSDVRYDYFDEYYVAAKHQCAYSFAWQVLYNRTLVPVDTIVRCTFLKQQYRNTLLHAGAI